MKITMTDGDIVSIDTDERGAQVTTIEFNGDWHEIEQQIRSNRKKRRAWRKAERTEPTYAERTGLTKKQWLDLLPEMIEYEAEASILQNRLDVHLEKVRGKYEQR